MERIALIDGDIFAYRYSFANQHVFDFGDTGRAEVNDLKHAQADLDRVLREIVEKLKATSLVICLTGPTNFRFKLNPKYKANRKKLKRPQLLKGLRHYMLSEYPCEMYPQCEADDVLGILHTMPRKEKTVIVSTDKDMLTLPGELYNPTKNRKKKITKKEAMYAFYLQTLMGDPVDGYSGIPNVGPKRASDFLGERDGNSSLDYWKTVVAAYETKGLTEKDALLMARMVRILTWDLWDEKKQEVILWEPPIK